MSGVSARTLNMPARHVIHAIVVSHPVTAPHRALQLWVEDVAEAAVVDDLRIVDKAPPQDLLPEKMRAYLRAQELSDSGRGIVLADRDGYVQRRRLPVLTLNWTDAIEFLALSASLMHGGGAISGLSAEVQYLVDLYEYLSQAVRAGHITIGAVELAGHSYPRWVLAPRPDIHDALRQFQEGLPQVLSLQQPGVDVLGHCINAMTPVIVNRRIRDSGELPCGGEFDVANTVRVLLSDQPAARDAVHGEVKSALEAVMVGQRRQSARLALRLSSIDSEVAIDRQHSETCWRLEPLWEMDGQPAKPIDITASFDEQAIGGYVGAAPRDARSVLRAQVGELEPLMGEISYVLDPLTTWLETGAWIPRGRDILGIAELDWGAGFRLTDKEVAAFLTCVPKLEKAGIRVEVPAEWARVHIEARAKVEVPAGKPSVFDEDTMLDFSFDLAIDGHVLTPEQREEILSSSRNFVEIADRYVWLSPRKLQAVREWVARFTDFRDGGDDGQSSTPTQPMQVTAADIIAADLVAHHAAQKNADRIADLEMDLAWKMDADEDIGEDGSTHSDETTLPQVTIDVSGAPWLKQLLEVTQSANVPSAEPVEPAPIPQPEGFVGELRPHQLTGLSWLVAMRKRNFGGILADDMGLGKTAQVLALLLWEREQPNPPGPTLVVCPASVVQVWAEEAAAFAPSLRVLAVTGPRTLAVELAAVGVGTYDLVIVSYERFTHSRRLYHQVAWERVVADEAQRIKNPMSARSRALRALPAKQKIAVTGTPIENDLMDLYALMDFANSGILGSAVAFRKRIARPIELWDSTAQLMWLKAMTRVFVLRREKHDPGVGLGLPGKREHEELVSITPEQAGLYAAEVERASRKIQEAKNPADRRLEILTTLTRLKQICVHPALYGAHRGRRVQGERCRSPKLDRAVTLTERALAQGRKVVIFTQYPSAREIVISELRRRLGLAVDMLHGGTPLRRRRELIADFQDPAGAKVLLLSVLAGGVGITLTQASVVIHLDRWWNPAVEDQATDRAYRIGQGQVVDVYTLTAAGTIEDRIAEVLAHKRELADRVVRPLEELIADLTAAEIDEIWALRHSASRIVEGNRL